MEKTMYYVVGLGQSGRSFLKKHPTSLAWDDKMCASSLTSPSHVPWDRIKAVILSPGISQRPHRGHPIVDLAYHNKVPIWCDVEVFLQGNRDKKYVGVTGTNGKSTTTLLIHHLLEAGRISSAVGGNIGIPIFDMKGDHQNSVHVLELSSYQLERMPSWGQAKESIGVLTNIFPDHLHHHGGMEAYCQAKERIFKAARVFVDVDSGPSRVMYERHLPTHPCLIPVSVKGPLGHGGIWVQDGFLYDDGVKVFSLAQFPKLPGVHNAQNMAFAYGVAKAHGMTPETIEKAMGTFQGVPHRQEYVGSMGNVTFVNDSKATNAHAVSYALGAHEDIFWLLGGVAKENLLEGLDPFYDRVQKAYVFGQAAATFQELLHPHMPVSCHTTMDQAMEEAVKDAKIQDRGVILLSPACASYDQYAHFQERGDHFKRLAAKYVEDEDTHAPF